MSNAIQRPGVSVKKKTRHASRGGIERWESYIWAELVLSWDLSWA